MFTKMRAQTVAPSSRMLMMLAALLAIICLSACTAHARETGFDQQEVDPTVARGEAGHSAHYGTASTAPGTSFDAQGQPNNGYAAVDLTPRHTWSEAEADKFFSHPSVQNHLDVLAFKKFLVDNGFHASKLELHWAPECGFHLVVTEPANALEEMMSVPANMFFHIYNQNLRNNTKYLIHRLHEYFFGPGIESEIDDVARVAMVIALLAEKRAPDSYWASYLQILPKPTLPFMLSPEEAAELELGRPTDFVINSRARLLEDLARIALAPEFSWLAKEFDESKGGLLPWAVAIIGSRTFSWGLGKFGNHLVMMPALDFINHNNDVPNHYEYTENQDLRYIVPNNVKPGEEVAIAYYPHATNFYLFHEYGFVLPRNTQDHILVEVNATDASKLYQSAYDLPKRIVIGYNDHVPYKFIRAINMALLDGEDKVTAAAYNVLIDQLNDQLNSYSTTFEQDVETLKRSDLPPKQRLVISMRTEAKRLLLDAIQSVKNDAEAFATRGIDAVMAYNSARQPSDVYLDEPLRIVTLNSPKQA